MKVQVHIYYSGIVQGVGFRYTTQRFAANLGLVGWVKNLSDGRVEMIAVGEQKQINELIQQIESRFSGSLDDTDVTYDRFPAAFKDFRVM
ncbi:MAG: acylphosphatase [Candidatus Omnitrophica bacterium]|nr:acylphosphatase [Candidatus Omnitrophota bacterium]